MSHNKKVGDFGEKLAKEFLIRKGYNIIDTNIKTGYKEIDLVAEDKNELVFVEVKTRTSFCYGSAEEAIVSQKTDNLRKAISIYLNRKKNIKYFFEIRADLIAVDIDRHKKTANIKHYKNII